MTPPTTTPDEEVQAISVEISKKAHRILRTISTMKNQKMGQALTDILVAESDREGITSFINVQ